MSKADTHTQSDYRRIGRRNFIRASIGTAAAVGTGGLGLRYGSRDAEAIAPAVAVGVAVAGGMAAGYLTRYIADKYTGNDVDAAKYDALTASETHAEIIEDAKTMAYSNDQVLTNMSNLLNLSQNAAFSDAKKAAFEQWNLGNGETAGTDAGVAKINDFYAVQQENVLEHLTFQAVKFDNMYRDAEAKSIREIFLVYNDDGKTGWALHDQYSDRWGTDAQSVTLANGTSYNFETHNFRYDQGGSVSDTHFPINSSTANLTNATGIYLSPSGSGSDVKLYDHTPFYDVWTEISNQLSTVTSEFQTWATNVYSAYSSGDIDLTDAISASDLANEASTQEGFAYAGASLALMGVEGAPYKTQVYLYDDDTTVTGTIYIPGYSKTLSAGVKYSPSQFTNTVYLAYEYTDAEGALQSTLVVLEQPFEITEAIDKDGNNVETLEFETRNQQTTTTDIQELQNEINRLNELQTELQEEQDAVIASSGGGGGILPDGQLIDGISNKVLGLGAAAVAIYGIAS